MSAKTYTFTAATGSSGNIGGNAARALLRRAEEAGQDVRVRVAARNVDKAKKAFAEFGDRVEVVEFDFTRPETYAAAVEGAEAVFVGVPETNGLDTPERIEAFLKAAEAVQPRPPLLTRLASGHMRHGEVDARKFAKQTGCVLFDNQFFGSEALEAAREAARVPVVLVDVSAWFFQNLSTQLRPFVAAGELALPNDNANLSRIDTRDVGEFFAAVMLGRDEHENRDYLVTGAVRMTPAEQVRVISEATGRTVTSSTGEEPLKSILSQQPAGPGVTMWDLMLPFHRTEALFGAAKFDLVPETYERVTGLTHRRFEDYVREEAAKGVFDAAPAQ